MASRAIRASSAGKARSADDHDNPWKEAIVGAFPEFMAFFFPQAHAGIDWSRGHTFLDKELRQVVRDAASGKRFVDVLVRVTGVDATLQLLYVHVEVQTQRDEAFARRMFTYNHRLLDRWNEPVASFAVLADDSPGWRPTEYRMTALGCEHVMRFPVAKLLDFEPRLAELPHDGNSGCAVAGSGVHRALSLHAPARHALISTLGLVEVQRFVAALCRDRFNCTPWRRSGLPQMSAEDIAREANHPPSAIKRRFLQTCPAAPQPRATRIIPPRRSSPCCAAGR